MNPLQFLVCLITGGFLCFYFARIDAELVRNGAILLLLMALNWRSKER